MVQLVKNLPANARDIRDAGLIPGLGRSPGGVHSNPLQYSCLENLMDRGARWAIVHGIAEESVCKQLSTHTSNLTIMYNRHFKNNLHELLLTIYIWGKQDFFFFTIIYNKFNFILCNI